MIVGAEDEEVETALVGLEGDRRRGKFLNGGNPLVSTAAQRLPRFVNEGMGGKPRALGSSFHG